MDFYTQVDIPASPFKINHRDKIMMLGSCFIENMGRKLIDNKFNTNLNPFGILYNPQSIAQSLEMLMNSRTFTESDLFEDGGVYNSYYHHSRFSGTDKAECLTKINWSIEKASEYLRKGDLLFITFGTAYVFRHKELDLVVSNCHKSPAKIFDRYKLSVDQIVDCWRELISRIKKENPELKIIFTVSPIRHLRDGAHDNQLSKSTLLLAIDELNKLSNCTYFPSYEIVLDELRDYRFYNEDMVHPNETSIKYIWKRFSETYFDRDAISIIEEWNKLHTAINHRPINQDSDEYKRFLDQTLLKLKTFAQKYPYICCKDELLLLESRMIK